MRKIKNLIIVLFVLAFSLSFISAAADFDVTTFSCTPAEVVINDVFSCTAQIKNNGDTAGAVNELRLYPDSNAWLEQSNYLQSSGTSVSPGQSIEITFSGLRATKSGNNGFARVALDNVDDTYVADNNVKENVIDVSVTTSQSASSKAASQTFTTTPNVIAGGNIDATLTLTIDSGGCSIGNQASSRTTTGLTHQQTWNGGGTWTITMGTSGDCQYTLSAAATGANGVATKTSSVSKTVTCSSGCSSGSSSGSSGGGGGGGGGGAGIGTKIASIGELTTSVEYEIGKNEHISFSFGEENHSVSITNLTETEASVVVRSNEKKFKMTIQEEKRVDFEDDGKDDISIKLKSINIIRKKALFIVTPLYIPAKKNENAEKKLDDGANDVVNKDNETQEDEKESSFPWMFILVLLIGILAIGIGIIILKKHSQGEKLRRAVNMKHFSHHK